MREALAEVLRVADDPGWERLEGMLPVLAAWRRAERDSGVLAGWRYREAWTPVTALPATVLTGTWLVIVPGIGVEGRAGGVAEWCVAALERRGARVAMAAWEDGLDRAVAGERLRAALAGAADCTGGDSGVAGVMWLAGLADGSAAGYPVVPEGLAGTVTVVQALGDAGIGAPLWVVTCGAVAAAGEELGSVVQAQLWGLGRVAALEYPDRWGGLVDLPPVLDELAGERLCSVLAGAGEDQVAVRASGVYARRLVRAPVKSPAPGRGWASQGTVLVTGGTGAIGGHLACWLAGRGAARVVLASRSGPAAAGAAVLAARAAGRGTRVQAVACDVAERAALAALLARIGAAGEPLTAVMHAAAVLDDGVIDGLDAARLAGVAGPKAAAALGLHELTQDMDLDAFVLFSAAATTWGSPGQGNYAAANAFLDALACQRRARGLSALSVAWGPWADGGLADTELVRQRLERAGMPPMAPRGALAALGQALAQEETLLTIADVNWARFVPRFTAVRPSPLLSGLAEAAGLSVVSSAGSGQQGPSWTQQLAPLPESGQKQAVLDLVRAEAAAVLGHTSADAVEPGRSFLELGFDSLTAVELRNRLGLVTGLQLPSSVVFDHPTTDALALLLQTKLSVTRTGGDGSRLIGQNLYLVSADAMPTRSLSGLFDEAVKDGREEEFMSLIRDLSRFRPQFSSQSDLEVIPEPIPVSRGPVKPQIFCLTSFFGKSGAHQYARFSRGFSGDRDISVLTTPGFAGGEPLPATAQALIEMHADTIERAAQGEPFVIAGYSSGGLIAHAVAAHLESKGIGPAAVVLIDTYSPESNVVSLPELWRGMITRNERLGEDWGDSWLTAMAHYFTLDWWHLAEISTPTLLVRAGESFADSSDHDWQLSWRFARSVSVVDVLGDHFTMMEDHADATAEAVRGWLERGLR